MSEKIITKPPTPEYNEAWERVFGNKKDEEAFNNAPFIEVRMVQFDRQALLNVPPTELIVFPEDYETALKIIKNK